MAITKTKYMDGLFIWQNTEDPASVWLEMGKGKADTFIMGSKAAALVALLTIPTPANIMVGFVVNWWRSQLKKHVGSRGIWIKGQMVIVPGENKPRVPVEARKRTQTNMLKAPNPW